MIERKRAEKGLKTLEAEKRAPHYIATAADSEHRLGTAIPAAFTWSRSSRAGYSRAAQERLIMQMQTEFPLYRTTQNQCRR